MKKRISVLKTYYEWMKDKTKMDKNLLLFSKLSPFFNTLFVRKYKWKLRDNKIYMNMYVCTYEFHKIEKEMKIKMENVEKLLFS